MFFKQIRQRGDNFTYLIADDVTKEAVVVDPSFNSDATIQLVKDHALKVNYVIDTHSHTDHTAGNEKIKSELGARIIAHKSSSTKKDLEVADGDTIQIGKITFKVIHTPGHTPDSICLLVNNKILTGDTLFVGECGRTDLPGGSPEDMYHSLFDRLTKLNDATEVYPGHDYGSKPHSTIGDEKKTNYVLEKRSLREFIEFMKEP